MTRYSRDTIQSLISGDLPPEIESFWLNYGNNTVYVKRVHPKTKQVTVLTVNCEGARTDRQRIQQAALTYAALFDTPIVLVEP